MRRYVVTAAAVGLIVAGTSFAIFRPHAAAAQQQADRARAPSAAQTAKLEASSFAALNRRATLVEDVPEAARTVGPSYRPAAGEVHRLGPNGMLLAWIHGTEVCEAEENGWGCVPPQPGAVELTVEDPDAVGEGVPARAIGLAVDDVVGVKVILDDGWTAQAAPVNNVYSIDLPAYARPPFPMTVEATMADGSIYRTHIPH